MNMEKPPSPDASLLHAHEHSSLHAEEIKRSSVCGCFSCLRTYPPSEILTWVDDKRTDGRTGLTAVCPYCSVDSVIGSASGYPITEQFLSDMKCRWF